MFFRQCLQAKEGNAHANRFTIGEHARLTFREKHQYLRMCTTMLPRDRTAVSCRSPRGLPRYPRTTRYERCIDPSSTNSVVLVQATRPDGLDSLSLRRHSQNDQTDRERDLRNFATVILH